MALPALEEFRNEQVDITEFLWERPGFSEPTAAYCAVDERFGGKLKIELYPEDRKAIERAGYVIESDSEQQRPVNIILDDTGRKIRWVIDPRGKQYETRPAREPIPMTHGQPIGAPRTEPVDGTAARKPEPQLELVPPPTSKASLYAKIARVMGEVNPVGERGHHGQGYTYATDGDMFNAVRASMADANLAMLPPRIMERKVEGQDTYISLEFTIADGDSGEVIVTPWIAKLQNNNDKAIHAAMTMCVKYFLKYTFLIATEGDADADQDSGERRQSRQQKQQTTRKPNPQQQSPKKTEPASDSKFDPERRTLLVNDARVKEVTKVPREINNTIDKMWVEGELKVDMDHDTMADLLIARLQKHQQTRANLGAGTEQRRIPAKSEGEVRS